MKQPIPFAGVLFCCGLLWSCSNLDGADKDPEAAASEAAALLAPKENFNDTLQGREVRLYYLENRDVAAAITNFGGRVVNLLVPDRDGKMTDVAVGPDSFDGFRRSGEPYFGALIGRYGNRIAKGKFSLDGVTYTLPRNNGPNTLHGGGGGFHNVVWEATQLSDSSLQLRYTSADGEEGFPGTLAVTVVYTLTAGRQLKVDYEAATDKPTVVNLTSHTFFNLNGGGTINDHPLLIPADYYTPVDSTLIPLGKQEPVAGTPFDFRRATPIGARVDEEHTQLGYGKGYDHNFVINGQPGALRLAAEISGDKSGIVMQLFSTEPGLQFYGGNFMRGQNPLKGGTKDEYRTAFALEPQHFPDSPNQPSFPSTVLKPGDVYRTHTAYRFKTAP